VLDPQAKTSLRGGCWQRCGSPIVQGQGNIRSNIVHTGSDGKFLNLQDFSGHVSTGSEKKYIARRDLLRRLIHKNFGFPQRREELCGREA